MRRRFIKNQVKVNPDKCLSIEAIEDNVEISTDISLIEYSINGGAWSKLEKGYVINLMKGHVALFKRSAGYLGTRLGSFHIVNKCKLSGNCMALLYGENSDKNFDLSACVNVFNHLFENCSSIISVSRDFLPATTLADYCYDGMFYGCTGLTSAPELPATTLANFCYRNMFLDCTSLTSAPELPATTLADYCYSEIFKNCTSLTSAPELPATTLASNCYSYMFSRCTSLVNAPELPATILLDSCYRGMFYGCTSLTSAPKLPATTLTDSCYSCMFLDCTSLVNAPQLPATTLKDSCYYNMFSGCTSLVNAPELPAITLAKNCYFDMFFGCTKLTNAPELPATTLTDGCYLNMFSRCTSLVNAPELPATILLDSCYRGMFYGCTNLNYIKALFTTIPSTSSTTNWVSGVASTGTFVKSKNATWNTTPGALGHDGVPAGWTVVNDGEVNLINFTISSFIDDYPEKTYQAEEGMTWEDFCNSKYNVDNWYLRDAGVKTLVIHQYGNEEAVCLNGGAVGALDIIVPSGSYKYYP